MSDLTIQVVYRKLVPVAEALHPPCRSSRVSFQDTVGRVTDPTVAAFLKDSSGFGGTVFAMVFWQEYLLKNAQSAQLQVYRGHMQLNAVWCRSIHNYSEELPLVLLD